MTIKEKKKQDAIAYLKRFDWHNDALLIVIRSVSSSGMTRRMEVYSKNDNAWLTHYVSDAIGWSYNDRGLLVSGCGMDMAFHLADTITWVVFGHDDAKKTLKGNGSGCIPWKTL